MKIYYKYLLKHLAANNIIITIVLSIILWFLQAPKLTTLIVNNGLNFKHFFVLSLLTLPYILITISPLSCFLSIIYVYTKFINDKEIIAFENTGLSFNQLTRPIIDYSIILCIVSYIFSFYFLPLSNKIFYHKLTNLKESFAYLFLETKTFNHPLKKVVIYFDEQNNTNLKDIFIFDGRSDHDTSIVAKKGSFKKTTSGIFLTLTNGSYIHLDNNNQLQILHFDETHLNLTPATTTFSEKRRMEALYINELIFPKKIFSEKLQKKYIAEAHRRITWPLYNIVLSFIAATCLLKGKYSRNGCGIKIFFASLFTTISIIINISLNSISINHTNFLFVLYANIILTIIFCIINLSLPNYLKKFYFRSFKNLEFIN